MTGMVTSRRMRSGRARSMRKRALKPFDASRADPFLMKAGDAVQFYPIARDEYDRIETSR